MAQRWHPNRAEFAPSTINLYALAAVPRDPQLVSLPISVPVSIPTALVGGNPAATPQNSQTTTIMTGVASSTSTTVNDPRQTVTASGSASATELNSAGNTATPSRAISPSESDSATTSVPSGINDLNMTLSIGPGGVPVLKALSTLTSASPFHTHLPDSQSSGGTGATTADSGTNWGDPESPGSQPGLKAKYAAIAAVVVVLILILLSITLFCFRRRHRKPLLPRASRRWSSIKPTKPTSGPCNNGPSTRSSWSSFGSPFDRVTGEGPRPQISPLPRLSDANSLVHQSDRTYSPPADNPSTSSLLSVSPCLSIFTTPSYKEADPVPSMESYLLSGQNDDAQCVEGQQSDTDLPSSYGFSSNTPVPTTPPVPSPDYNLFVGRNPFDNPS